ncbi:SIS domain-containing protein, partial [Flavobacterium sp.]|uniref:SIS domain-containing protein n=1 Tax=Flavobacterium sp. TaxID=239 RepID=UPI0037C0558C
MNTTQTILENARQSILSQSESIAKLTHYLSEDFAKTVQLIFESKGRLVVTGIGKSAIIAQKIVATLNSTGTPSIFLHAAEAIHGDLGMIQKGDLVLCISKSGNSPEIKVLAPIIKNFGTTLIGMTANSTSFLAASSDLVLLAHVDDESCPL